MIASNLDNTPQGTDTEEEFAVEVRMRRVSSTAARASVHVDIGHSSGITISNILVFYKNGRLVMKLPPMGERPDISLQGTLKAKIQDALAQHLNQFLGISPNTAPNHLR